MSYPNTVYTVKVEKDRERECLVCSQVFKTDRFTYICNRCKSVESRDEMRANSRAGQMARRK